MVLPGAFCLQRSQLHVAGLGHRQLLGRGAKTSLSRGGGRGLRNGSHGISAARARSGRGFAATELDGDRRNEPALVWGEVRDGNAWALGELPATRDSGAADDVACFVGALLSPRHHPVLTYGSLAKMTRCHAGSPPEVRGLGWRLDPKRMGMLAGGHLLAHRLHRHVAPRRAQTNLGVVLLTNAVRPQRHLDEQADFGLPGSIEYFARSLA